MSVVRSCPCRRVNSPFSMRCTLQFGMRRKRGFDYEPVKDVFDDLVRVSQVMATCDSRLS